MFKKKIKRTNLQVKRPIDFDQKRRAFIFFICILSFEAPHTDKPFPASVRQRSSVELN
jgi:hypothetical protein